MHLTMIFSGNGLILLSILPYKNLLQFPLMGSILRLIGRLYSINNWGKHLGCISLSVLHANGITPRLSLVIN